MNACLSLLLLFGPGFAHGQPILFRSAGAPESEYRARLRSDEALRSPVGAYLDQHPLGRSRGQLIERFTRAQHAYLEGEVGEARRYFQEVTALLPTDDWRIEQREIFLHAFLRLAQMEHDESARERWLIEAQYLGQDVNFDENLFPPPIVRRHRDLSRQLPRIRPSVEASGWPLILINGVRCSATDCPTVPAPSHDVRVTFVSDQWVTQSQQIDVASLARLRPPRFTWVTGECGKSDLLPAARALGTGRAFFGFNCEAPRLVPQMAAAPAVDPAASGVSTQLRATTAPVARRPFYRSPWLWAGVGAAVVTGVALSLKSGQRDRDHHVPPGAPPAPPPGDQQPTTIYGY